MTVPLQKVRVNHAKLVQKTPQKSLEKHLASAQHSPSSSSMSCWSSPGLIAVILDGLMRSQHQQPGQMQHGSTPLSGFAQTLHQGCLNDLLKQDHTDLTSSSFTWPPASGAAASV
mmetsp:Transcript_21364/g.41877  ORF Transcript_21364/g.41877 Transcript_21364/m.41877 type:complete len:115 (+) Transcript_21364:3423-3767(+)